MKRTRVVCPCSVESPCGTEDERRALGWRLALASSDPPARRGDVFVWVCPSCAANRIALLRAS